MALHIRAKDSECHIQETTQIQAIQVNLLISSHACSLIATTWSDFAHFVNNLSGEILHHRFPLEECHAILRYRTRVYTVLDRDSNILNKPLSLLCTTKLKCSHNMYVCLYAYDYTWALSMYLYNYVCINVCMSVCMYQ